LIKPFSAFPIDLRLAPVIHLPAFAFQPQPSTLIGVGFLTCLRAGLQLASATNLLAWPSDRSSTCVSDPPSGSAFRISLRLAPHAALRAAFQPVPGSRLRPVFWPNLPVALQLAPSTNLPAPPSNLTSDSHRPLTLRRCPPVYLRLSPPIYLSALPDESHARHRLLHLRLCLPANLRLASLICRSA